MARNPWVAGLDIGTHQITAAVGQAGENGSLELLALKSAPTQGIERGVIVDLADCVDSIARVIRQVEEQAETRITMAAATLHGPNIRRHNAVASITLNESNTEIGRWDVERVLSGCRSAAASYDRKILHEFVQRFSVDDQEGVRNPVGLFGGKLEAALHVVTIPTSTYQSWRKALNHAGVEVSYLMLPGPATSFAVLSELDRELGAIVVDIGGAHTDVVCCVDGAIRETLAVPWGGDQMTEKIAEKFELPLSAAEQVKLQCNSVELNPSKEDVIRVSVGQGSRSVARAQVAALLHEEAAALFKEVHERLEASHYFREASSGMLVTGGTALMEGMLETAESICNLPTRLGVLRGVACPDRVTLTPTASTAIGLLVYQLSLRKAPPTTLGVASARPWGRFVQKAKTLLEDYF